MVVALTSDGKIAHRGYGADAASLLDCVPMNAIAICKFLRKHQTLLSFLVGACALLSQANAGFLSEQEVLQTIATAAAMIWFTYHAISWVLNAPDAPEGAKG